MLHVATRIHHESTFRSYLHWPHGLQWCHDPRLLLYKVAEDSHAGLCEGREVAPGDGYRASQADFATWDRARRPKRCELRGNGTLARNVAAKLRMFWSPEQIAGWLKHICSRDESLQLGDYSGAAQKRLKAICAG